MAADSVEVLPLVPIAVIRLPAKTLDTRLTPSGRLRPVITIALNAHFIVLLTTALAILYCDCSHMLLLAAALQLVVHWYRLPSVQLV
jgi:hypothetical protein